MSKPKLQMWHDMSDVPMINEPVLLKYGIDIHLYEVITFPNVESYISVLMCGCNFKWCYCSRIEERTPMEKAAPEMYEAIQTILDNAVVNGVYRVRAENVLKKARGEE